VMPPEFDLEAWRAWYAGERAAVDELLATHVARLRACDSQHSRLLEAVEYSLRQGGKRLRPILVRAACEACGGDVAAATPAAIAVECIHTFSLIHDDLPAMDDDDLRRGQPTNHKVFGEALAILAGDWLVAHAFMLLADPDVSAERSGRLVRALGMGSLAMVSGQASDIEGEQQPPAVDRVQHIHRHKTASLIEACGRLGAASAGVSVEREDALGAFGAHLGLAFQIIDDLLDCTASTEQLGKTAGKDAAVSKQTYPAVFGMEASRAQARREVDAALATLDPFGDAANRLRGLAYFVISRDR
jgi:geranylgeranyl diphosphate synthase type II